MMKVYKDFYGCRATILVLFNGMALLKIKTPQGHTVIEKAYNTERGARIAMGKCTDGGWIAVKE